MRLTVRRVYDFGRDREHVGADLLRPDAWDAARETEGPFGLPPTRAEWERAAAGRADLGARADDVAHMAHELGARSLCSHGVGTGLLELELARRLPGMRLICTDYAPRTVERLRALFPAAEIVRHDLRKDEPPPADIHLMHRIDTELSDAEWRGVLPRYREPIVFVPGELVTLLGVAREVARAIAKPRATRAGWARNENALRALWRATHDDRELTVGGRPAFLLTRRAS